MNLATRSCILVLAALFIAVPARTAGADIVQVLSEHVTGGNLDLVWVPRSDAPSRNLQAVTLDSSHPAYLNPSGDHTVGVAVNAIPDSGGIVLSSTDPGTFNTNYTWEGWMFTGDGSTRRGLAVRVNPANGFQTGYVLVVNSGRLQIQFRKLEPMGATVLGSWFATSVPEFGGGLIPENRWVKLKVVAVANTFRCFINDYELNGASPIADNSSPLLSGWVGCYNFRFDLGLQSVYFDDLVLTAELDPTPALKATWGGLKARYR